MSHLSGNLLVFGRMLREAGVDVPVGSLLDLITALTHVNLAERHEVFYACRAVLVRHHDQLALFERVFDAFWRDHLQAATTRPGAEARRALPHAIAASTAHVTGPLRDGDEQDEPVTGVLRSWSDAPGLVHKDFAEFSPDELARAEEALEGLAWSPGVRRTRRWVPGRGPRIDLRRALARSLRTGGDVVTIPRRRRRVYPRPLVLLCDVSGSMERYTRMLLHFAHALGRRHHLEVFLFSTSLTRVTRQIRRRRPGDAVVSVARAVRDWSGGTRIGHALLQFHQKWSRRVLHQGPVVLLISDGWDRGDPAVLGAQIARLQRSCHRLVWLNPLIGTEDFAPLTRGLQAALPFVDDFLAVRTIHDLHELALHLSSISAGTRDPRTSRPVWTSQAPTRSMPLRPASGTS